MTIHLTNRTAPATSTTLISKVNRIGEWSPNAGAVHDDEVAEARVGAWLSGRNRKAGKE
jgi:hypothetical protein